MGFSLKITVKLWTVDSNFMTQNLSGDVNLFSEKESVVLSIGYVQSKFLRHHPSPIFLLQLLQLTTNKLSKIFLHPTGVCCRRILVLARNCHPLSSILTLPPGNVPLSRMEAAEEMKTDSTLKRTVWKPALSSWSHQGEIVLRKSRRTDARSQRSQAFVEDLTGGGGSTRNLGLANSSYSLGAREARIISRLLRNVRLLAKSQRKIFQGKILYVIQKLRLEDADQGWKNSITIKRQEHARHSTFLAVKGVITCSTQYPSVLIAVCPTQ